MQANKPVGRNAATLKYDLLTVMGAYALSSPKGRQVLVFRLMTLITARYNWVRDELTVGQNEIAKLWNVDPRTVKREFAKLRAMGWLVMRRAGVRGRVAEYGLDLTRILRDTQPRWGDVGPDLSHRLAGDQSPAQSNIVPLAARRKIESNPPEIADGTEWSLAKALLHAADPALYAGWIAPLARAGRSGNRLHLAAPSRFHAHYVSTHLLERLSDAVRSIDPEVADVVIVVGTE